MPFGLPGATAISRTFVAKSRGQPVARSDDESFAMLAWSAEANTSAGAPFCTWLTRSLDPANENVTVVPGWSASNCSPSAVKVFWREAAANTVMLPEGVAEADGVPVPVPLVAGCAVHPVRARPATTSRTAERRSGFTVRS